MRRCVPRAPLAPLALLILVTNAHAARGEVAAEINLQIVTNGGEGSTATAAAPAAPARDDHIRALTSPDPAARIAAVRALAAVGDASAVPALSRALQADPNPLVRGWIVRALHQLGTPEALAVVRAAAQRDTDPRVRALVVTLMPDARPQVAAGPQTVVQPRAVAAGTGRSEQPEHWSAHRRRSPGLGLRISGWILFGVSYALGLTSGMLGMMVDVEVGGPLMIPFVGPAIAGTIVLDDRLDEFIGLGVMAWILTAAQTAGFAMAIAGHVRGRRARREAERGLAVFPTVAGDQVGLAAIGRF